MPETKETITPSRLGLLLGRESRQRWFEPACYELQEDYLRDRRGRSRLVRSLFAAKLQVRIFLLTLECLCLRLMLKFPNHNGWQPAPDRTKDYWPETKSKNTRTGGGFMEHLFQDLRYGARTLLKKPGFTIVAILALALGIGANTAIFSVVNGVLLQPLPYEEPGQLVEVWNQIANDGLPKLWFSEPEFLYYRENNQSLEGMAGYTTGGANLTGEGDALRVTVSYITTNLFSVLGAQPFLGRDFTPEEDIPGNDQVLILENGFWQRRFGGDTNIIGKKVTFNGQPVTIVGVMPEGFAYPPNGEDMWTPLAIDTANPRGAGSHYLRVISRLKPGVTFDQGMADIKRTAIQYAHFNQNYFGTNPEEAIQQMGWGAYLIPMHESFVGDVRPALLILLGAVGLVLLIACINVANLLLARAASREKEVAVRMALGAGRGRIIQQLMTESVILALLGGAAGLLVAYWGIEAIVTLGLDNLPRQETIQLDLPVLGFTLGLSLVTGILFGLAPALHSSKADLHDALKEGGRGSGTGGRHRLRSLLVVAEVALAIVLLIGSGLLIQSFASILQVDPGYRTDQVLTFRLSLPSARYADNSQVNLFYAQLIEKIRALPGVKSAGANSLLPLSGRNSSGTVSVESPSVPFEKTSPNQLFAYAETDGRPVTPGYFQTMGMTLIQGRLFEDSDNAEAPLVAIVDETFARRFWVEESPLGKRITFGGGATPQWRTIVGVAKHINHNGPNLSGREQMYVPLAQAPRSGMYMVIHTAGDPTTILSSVREQIRSLDSELPVFDIQTMEERLAGSVAQERFNMLLLGIFAAVALVLASLGIYGVMAYNVSQRTHEIGIRMAMGAQNNDVIKMVVGQAMILIGIGSAVGLALAFAFTRIMASLLFGVTATDPMTFTMVPIILAAVALLACYIPARRATRIDPMIALRYE